MGAVSALRPERTGYAPVHLRTLRFLHIEIGAIRTSGIGEDRIARCACASALAVVSRYLFSAAAPCFTDQRSHLAAGALKGFHVASFALS